ncbi:regulatory protein ada [Bordetella holmesii CDC-H635-BH]|uniref:Regulatory protein ada n=3 Tax=Bordetella holmesii TaxID=35814 RepID=A0A158M6S2_9BORD|nr:regulatory protein ada [Bordetella holmesii CDC-H809-BH]KAK84871.1 regulatory protein ada [Bordetella holmesii H620]KAK86901.1 regulatory protein ada [Bordetella holmesii CDC-H572-BH]KAK89290.1 regulatory protein ada [Bordetella holmesii CDC-H635-BH]KAK96076.1 regulatory protein ada [Bordetella holmesii CDC-H585-BH]KCV04981.1 regulatory protein ada [Bordetella holmesii CDC-H629-BH]KCV05666.1 regulatory protein ada [Bordetella holmesii CDC-H719-BH]KCV08073.1 regulatory protein ada [Bordete
MPAYSGCTMIFHEPTMTPHQTDLDPRWAAVLARDPHADFVYGVKTTGVYNHPANPARLPRRENVEFFASASLAEAAGYRPSHIQSRVSLAHASWVAQACHRLETADPLPSLRELAAEPGVSSYHFHRVFKAATGLTPRAYAQAHRARRVRGQLDRGERVTTALYAAGFQSNSRFYASADSMLGMKPSAYREGGANARLYFALGQCSLGAILVAQSERGVCAILLGDDPEALLQSLQDRFPNAELIGGDPGYETLMATVVGMVEAPAAAVDLPLDVRGTAFQERVWHALTQIGPGQTVSYSDIAQRIGQPKAVRAVAQACAANMLAVAIPCHRVVRNDGSLSGYRWGVARKRELLRREQSQAT